VRSVDTEVPTSGVRTAEQILSSSVATQRFNLLLLGVFGGAALLLAAAGLYAVISYSVAQRTREIGIRLALGAKAEDMFRLILTQGLRLVLIGLTIGLAGALALTRLMKSHLYGVSATDPPTFVAVAVLLTVVALLACYIPARRATKVDPMTALRHE
jgi:putative ABC transport system permease protein